MATLSVAGLALRLGRFQLGPLDLEVAAGQTLVLLGPSGSGKTTLLEALAGFHEPGTGVIRLGGQDVTRLPPERRRLALVFQDYALFPHLTVSENVGFGLRYHHLPAERVEHALSTLGIADLATRRPHRLSGGERQRVALARALVTEPAAFLLDEPLAALDAVTRREIRDELGRFLRRLGATCIVVTHDYADAFALGDQVAVLAHGRIQQVGKPEWIYRRPSNAWVASFLGMEALRPERVEADAAQTAYVVAGVPLRAAAGAPPAGAQLVYRPEDVSLRCAEGAEANLLTGTIVAIRPESAFMRVEVSLANGEKIRALLSRRELQRIGAAPGQRVGCVIEPEDLWPVYDAGSEADLG